MTDYPIGNVRSSPSLRARAEIRLREKPQRGKNRKGGGPRIGSKTGTRVIFEFQID